MKVPIIAALCLATLGLQGAAHAQPCRAPASFTDKNVEALYEDGMARLALARQQKGERQREVAGDAEVRFRKILQAHPCLPSSLVGLGEALELQGKYREAIEPFQQVIDAESELQDEFWSPSVKEARTGLLRLRKRFAAVDVQLHRVDCARAAPQATVDGNPVRPGSGLLLDPGFHELRVRAAGCQDYKWSFSAAAGSEQKRQVDLKPVTQAPWRMPTWAWVTAGAVAAVGAGVGIYFLTRPDEPPPPPFDCAALGAGIGCIELN